MKWLFALGIVVIALLFCSADQVDTDCISIDHISSERGPTLSSEPAQTSRPVNAWDARSQNHFQKLDHLIDKRYVSANVSELRGLKNELETTLCKAYATEGKFYSK